MALVYADRVLETTTTTGTGALTLGGALTGYQAFSDAMSDGDTCHYSLFAVDSNGNPSGAWETGLGTYSSGMLTRTTVEDSSTGFAVDFAAGTKYVMLTATAASFSASGGSGGGGVQLVALPSGYPNDFATGSYATLADGFILKEDVEVDALYGMFNNAAAGDTYNMFIATVNNSMAITGTVATATQFTTTVTGPHFEKFDLPTPVTLAAGTQYIVALVNKSGTGTTPNRAYFALSGSHTYILEDFAQKTINWGGPTKRAWYAQNSDAPTSVSSVSNSTSNIYYLGMRITLP